MAAGAHFGCLKITFDCSSGHFRSIGHFGCLKSTFDSNYGHFRLIQNFIGFFRRPFWTSANHFRLHFWPFLIDRPYLVLNGCPKITFDGIFGHFRFFFDQNGRRRPFWMSENNFRLHFLPFQIDTQLSFLNVLTK